MIHVIRIVRGPHRGKYLSRSIVQSPEQANQYPRKLGRYVATQYELSHPTAQCSVIPLDRARKIK